MNLFLKQQEIGYREDIEKRLVVAKVKMWRSDGVEGWD